MIWIASSNLTNLSLIEGKGIPYANDSSSFQAAPIPMKSLPLVRTSRVAPIFAKIDGYRYIMPVIIVPNFILEVIPARTDMVVQLSFVQHEVILIHLYSYLVMLKHISIYHIDKRGCSQSTCS